MAKAKKQKEMEILLSVFSNNPMDEAAYQTLQLFYKGAVENSVGIMRALDGVTGETALILVGIEKDHSGIKTYPLARVLTPDDANNYFSPDGTGGWFDPQGPQEAEAMDFSMPKEDELSEHSTTN